MQRKTRGKKSLKNLAYVLLLAIVVYAAVYSFVFIGGPSFYGDDTVYLSLASYVAQGTFHQSPFIFSVRLLEFMPIAIFYSLFGISMYTSAAWDILSFLLSIVVAFFLCRELYDDRAGLFAALLLTFFPLAAELAPTISDDIPMMFMTSLAMLFLVMAQKRNSKPLYALCGVSVVASQLITPESIVIIFVITLYLIVEFLRRRIGRNVPYLFYGVLFAGGFLLLFNALNANNPFITITTNLNFYSAVGNQNTIPTTNTDPRYYLSAMFSYNIVSTLASNIYGLKLNPISIWQQIFVVNYNQTGFYFYALLIAALYLLMRNERGSYVPLFWLASGFLYLEFGPMHLSLFPFQYLLAYRLQRFLLFLAVPLAVALGIAMSKAIGKNKGAKLYLTSLAVAASMIFLIATSIPLNTMQYTQLSYARYDQLSIANYLNALPNTTVVYSASSLSNLGSYMMFSNTSRMHAIDWIQNCTAIPKGAYAVIPKNIQEYGLAYLPNPEAYCPAWKLVLNPQYPANVPDYIAAAGSSFEAKLYLVPGNSSSR